MVANYRKSRRFLESFIDYEKASSFSYKKSFKLKRVGFLFKHLRIPYQNLKVIHVAGTKGKGSTAKICAQSLAASGLKVGLYTSPHLFDFRERIRVGGRMISEKDLARIIEDFRKKVKTIKFPAKLGKISFFEIYTAIAFNFFLEKQVDYAVLETGLGGRLDATNIAKSSVSIITHIGYDHTNLLGRRLSQIAAEKAGIIKAGVPVVCSEQPESALKIIKQSCKAKESLLLILGRNFKVSNLRFNSKYTLFDFGYGKFELKNIKLSLLGKHQVKNAACALAAYFLLTKDNKLPERFNRSLETLTLEGRFELISVKPLVIVDVAHNPSSFSVLSDNLKLYYKLKKIILIFGCSGDKNAKGMLKNIPYQSLILTASKNSRAAYPDELKKQIKAEAVATANIRQAINKARQIYQPDSVIVISGSLFLAAEAKKLIENSSFFRNFS